MQQPSVKNLPKDKRIKSFKEVSLGFSKKICVEEARRCPQCADPVCMRGCPLGIDIPGFIRLLREGDPKAALEKIREQNSLPAVCGRICTAPCEEACILSEENAPIGIRALERFVADYGRSKSSHKRIGVRNNKKIAIIGSGPTGLSAAATLARLGYPVTIFEVHDLPGGVLRYGIPNFRLPKNILDSEIEEIKSYGVEIKTNILIGQTLTIEDLLKQGFQAVLLALGAGAPKLVDLPGDNLGGVYYDNEFLMRVNELKENNFFKIESSFYVGPRMAVIGSNFAALDCARMGVRLQRQVMMIFSHTEDDMQVHGQEKEYAKEEGVQLESLVKPLEILSNDHHFVAGLKCLRMDFADANSTEQSAHWEIKAVEGSEFVMDVDTVILAMGQKTNSLISRLFPKVRVNERGFIWTDPATGSTSMSGVFAGGNVTTGAGPVVDAIAAGKKAAENIHRYLKG